MSDPFAPSRAIDAIGDDRLQAFAEALIDRVTGIVGQHQVRVEEGQTEVQKAYADIRYQLAEGNAARASNAQQVALFLERLLKEQEAVQQGQTLLADEFSAVAQNVIGLTNQMTNLSLTVERHDQEIEEFRKDREELRGNQAAMSDSLARIEATLEDSLTAEEKHALRRLLSQLGGA